MKALSKTLKIVGLLLLLPVGAVVLSLLSGVMNEFDDSGFGSFYGMVDAHLLYFGEDQGFGVRIKGETPAQWHWVRPNNYQYRVLSLEWFADGGNRRGQIDTASMTLTLNGKSLPVSRSLLSDFLFGVSLNSLRPEDVEAIAFVEQFITEAGQGRLATPRHHSYQFKKPVSGMMVHFSLGSRYPYSLYWWTGAWCILCCLLALRARMRPVANGEPGTSLNHGPAKRFGNSGQTDENNA